jgi:hypothetical protein
VPRSSNTNFGASDAGHMPGTVEDKDLILGEPSNAGQVFGVELIDDLLGASVGGTSAPIQRQITTRSK